MDNCHILNLNDSLSLVGAKLRGICDNWCNGFMIFNPYNYSSNSLFDIAVQMKVKKNLSKHAMENN